MTNADDIFDITPVFVWAITQNQLLAEMRLEVGTIPEVHPIFFFKSAASLPDRQCTACRTRRARGAFQDFVVRTSVVIVNKHQVPTLAATHLL